MFLGLTLSFTAILAQFGDFKLFLGKMRPESLFELLVSPNPKPKFPKSLSEPVESLSEKGLTRVTF